jgi:hypothetical protein
VRRQVVTHRWRQFVITRIRHGTARLPGRANLRQCKPRRTFRRRPGPPRVACPSSLAPPTTPGRS